VHVIDISSKHNIDIVSTRSFLRWCR